MREENNRIRDFLGVTPWLKAGYTGAVGLAASGETWNPKDTADHGWKTWATFVEFAEHAQVISLTTDGIWGDNSFDRVVQGILAQEVDVWCASEYGNRISNVVNQKLATVVDRCTLIMSTGNTNSTKRKEASKSIESPYIWGVSACMLMVTGKLALAPYNFPSEHTEFCLPAGIWLPNNEHFTGTSASAQVLSGMVKIINHAFITHSGRSLSMQEMHDFLVPYCVPISGNPLYDGHGCPRLPLPETVDFEQYKQEVSTLDVIEHKWEWAYALTKRKKTDAVVLHHAAASEATPERIDTEHKKKSWAGIGYHYYVRKDGSIHRGRPERMSGAHVLNDNGHTLGICFEGNFDVDLMSAVQLNAGRILLADILTRYPKAKITKHKDWNATACPGENFLFDEMLKTPEESKEDDNMTGQEIYTALMEHLNALPESGWSQKEGHFKAATDAGVLDGTRPQAPVTREQLAAVLGRLGLSDKGAK